MKGTDLILTESESKAQEIYDILKLSASEVFNKEGEQGK